MSYVISGLPVEPFTPLFALSDEELSERGIIRARADSVPGYPCRITLEDAPIGERVLLVNHVSHLTDSPYRHSYAIYVRENVVEPAAFKDELPPVFNGRPISLRLFDAAGMLVGARMAIGEAVETEIHTAFERADVAYIHAHNSMHGCFVAEVRRAD